MNILKKIIKLAIVIDYKMRFYLFIYLISKTFSCKHYTISISLQLSYSLTFDMADCYHYYHFASAYRVWIGLIKVLLQQVGFHVIV